VITARTLDVPAPQSCQWTGCERAQAAAQHGSVHHPRQPHIIDVRAAPAHKSGVLLRGIRPKPIGELMTAPPARQPTESNARCSHIPCTGKAAGQRLPNVLIDGSTTLSSSHERSSSSRTCRTRIATRDTR